MSRSSNNKIKRLAAAMLCAMLVLGLSTTAFASTINRERTGTLKLQAQYDGADVAGGTFRIYHVASIAQNTAQLTYVLNAPFDLSSNADVKDINKVKTALEQQSAALTLQSMLANIDKDIHDIDEYDIDGGKEQGDLKLGIYLVVQIAACPSPTSDARYINASPFLAFLPYTVNGTSWDYSYTAHPKLGRETFTTPPPPGPNYTSVTINKVWDDAGNEDARPASITVALYRNGNQVETASLTAANGWSHTWNSLDDDYTWTADELGVPEGYIAYTSQAGNSFTVTNIFEDEEPPLTSFPPDPTDPEITPPATDSKVDDVLGEEETDPTYDLGEDETPLGDAPETGMLQWPIPVLAALGLLLIGTGLLSGRKKEYDN